MLKSTGEFPPRTPGIAKSLPGGSLFWLLLWTGLGLLLRLWNLDLKPVWGDEWSTLVFSLGNGYHSIPLNTPIALEELLRPLTPTPGLQFQAVIDRLHAESNHPPLFFLLLHFWLHLIPPDRHGWVSIGAARGLSVLFGVMTIPLSYGLLRRWTKGWVWSEFTSQMAALWVALSPFGVYLAQEARHYTLSMVWVLGLLLFLERSLQPRPLPWWGVGVWIGLNSLGMATHFFYGIALLAAGGVLLAQGLGQWLNRSKLWRSNSQQEPTDQAPWNLAVISRWGIAAIGTIASLSVWIPTWRGVEDSTLTRWLDRQDLLAPVGRLLLWILTSIVMLPVEGVPLPVAIGCGLILLGAFGLSVFFLWQALRKSYHLGRSSPVENIFQLLLQFTGLSLLIFCGLIYGLNEDLSLAPRYQFVYFPALILLFALAFSCTIVYFPQRRIWVGILCTIALLGSCSVVSNFAFQKSEQNDVFLAKLNHNYSPIPDSSSEPLSPKSSPIQHTQTLPIILATTYTDHADIGRLMGLAWEWQKWRSSPSTPPSDRFPQSPFVLNPHPQFVFISDQTEQHDRLQEILQAQTAPYLLGLVNFRAPYPLESLECIPQPDVAAAGYGSKFYRCGG